MIEAEASQPAGPASRGAPWPIAYYGAPMLLCLAVHWRSLKIWFFEDDFAWLGLRLRIHCLPDLAWALFHPFAQGTVRLWSERVFFLLFSSLFGVHPLPFHICVFLTQFASIALLISITRRITGSSLAGFLAPVLWCANAALALPMSWSSAYNEILCGFFLLLSFHFLLRHIETGNRGDLMLLWASYLMGFGALEHMTVFPAIAACYALCCQRKYFKNTLPLFVPAIVFTLIHFFLIPGSAAEPYRLHFDAGMFPSLLSYWALTLSAYRPYMPHGHLRTIALAFTAAASAALLGFAAYRSWRRDARGAFFLAFFVLLLAPVLPLRNHFSGYYAALPALGASMLAAWAVARAFGTRRLAPACLAAALAAGYAILSIQDLRVTTNWYLLRAHKLKVVLECLQDAQRLHPGATLLLAGVSNDLFWSGLGDHPFASLGIGNVLLAPGTETNIDPRPAVEGIGEFTMPAPVALRALREGKAFAYAVSPDGLIDVTRQYESVAEAVYRADRLATVDVGEPMFQGRLEGGWYAIDRGARWMAKSATVLLPGPKAAGEALYVTGFFPAALAAEGPKTVEVAVDGRALGSFEVKRAGQPFSWSAPLSGSLAGKPTVRVTVNVSRVSFAPPDTRPLGLVFGTFAIR